MLLFVVLLSFSHSYFVYAMHCLMFGKKCFRITFIVQKKAFGSFSFLFSKTFFFLPYNTNDTSESTRYTDENYEISFFFLRFHFSFFLRFINGYFCAKPNILRPKCQRGVTIKGTALYSVGTFVLNVCLYKRWGWAINNVIQYPIIGH